MRLHPEEFALARAWSSDQPFEGLSPEQLRSIHARAVELHRWIRAHPLTHAAISIAVLVFLFAADYWTLLRLPHFFIGGDASKSIGGVMLTGALAGAVHSYLLYSLAFFTMHDGYAHKVMFPMHTRAGRWAHAVGSNLCRVAATDPQYFTKHHLPHHLKFGSEDDGEFLNFVVPRRYWLSLLPLAAFTNYNDFLIHRPPSFTKSRLVSGVMAVIYNGIYVWLMYRAFGGLYLLAFMALLPHVGFYVDRLRQFTEHNLMPMENENGARSLGLGFWGLLLGGGPWGQPCHLEHHLEVGLPWFGQLILHGHLRSVLTPRQREQFLVQPVIGWPKLWWRIIRQSYAFQRRAGAGAPVGTE